MVKFLKIEIISSIFSNCSTMRLEISYKKKQQNHKLLEGKQYATKQPMDQWRNQRGNQKILKEKWQQRYNNPKPMGHSKSISEREVYSNIILSEERKKAQINNLTLQLRQLDKEEQTKPKISRKKEKSEQK